MFFKMKADWKRSSKVQCFPGSVQSLFAASSYLERHGTPNHPMDLAQHRCIGSGVWKLTEGRNVVTPDIMFHIVASDPGVHLQLACKAVGVAVLPLWMAKRAEDLGLLAPVLTGWKPEPITVCALHSGSTKVTGKVRAFLDFLSAHFRHRARSTVEWAQTERSLHRC